MNFFYHPLSFLVTAILLYFFYLNIPESVFSDLHIEKEISLLPNIYFLLFIFLWYLGYLLCRLMKPGFGIMQERCVVPGKYSLRILFIVLVMGNIVNSLIVVRVLNEIEPGLFFITPGIVHANIFQRIRIRGVTSLSQLTNAGLIIFVFLKYYSRNAPLRFSKLLIFNIVLGIIFTLYRGLYMTRTVIIEVAFPFLCFLSSKKVVLRKEVSIQGILKYLYVVFFGILFFVIAELRSYFAIQEAKQYSFLEWGFLRFEYYFATVFYYFNNIDVLDIKPLNKLLVSFVYLGGNTVFTPDVGVYIQGYSTFTGIGEYYTELGLGAVFYSLIQSFFTTYLFYRFIRGSKYALLYPTILLGGLFLTYVTYLNRSPVIILLAVLFAFSLTLKEVAISNEN